MQLDDNQLSLEANINGRKYYLICEKDSPIGEIHDVMCMLKNHIIGVMQNEGKPPQSATPEE